LYQRTIPEYWIVDPKHRMIEVWLPGAVEPAIHRDRLEWRPVGAASAFELDVPAYFAAVHGEP
jgi:Uma2 family endonuclease